MSLLLKEIQNYRDTGKEVIVYFKDTPCNPIEGCIIDSDDTHIKIVYRHAGIKEEYRIVTSAINTITDIVINYDFKEIFPAEIKENLWWLSEK